MPFKRLKDCSTVQFFGLLAEEKTNKYALLTKSEINMYALLTKCEVNETHELAKKERGQYPAILTEQAWSIKHLLYGFRRNVS